MDIVDLRDFYNTRLGIVTRRLIAARLKTALSTTNGVVTMGLGFASPYLNLSDAPQHALFSFMLARQGVVQWPSAGPVACALVDEFDLPLLESTVDLALVVHGLEFSENPAEMLGEIWRVLGPQGKLTLVVPNRRGLWAASERSPFGYGQPFSRPQLARLLRDAQFTPINWSQALVAPPMKSVSGLKLSPVVERVGFGGLSGVIVVEAIKQVYAFSSGKRVRRMLPRWRPALLPRPVHQMK